LVGLVRFVYQCLEAYGVDVLNFAAGKLFAPLREANFCIFSLARYAQAAKNAKKSVFFTSLPQALSLRLRVSHIAIDAKIPASG
jgi:hypothetical protein